MEDPDAVLPPAHLKELLNTLRKKVAQRIPGGAAGLMRCWLSFKQRCGSSKQGITYEEFNHGLTHGYGMPLEPRQMKALFRKMDANGDGGIEMHEWVDVIMGRWNPAANTHFGSKSAENISGGNKGQVLGQKAIMEHEDEAMTAEKAIFRLRVAIGQRIPIGGLIKCWTEFRQRAGAAKNGVLYEEFRRALRAYGIIMPRDESVALFTRMDSNGDGTIQMREFIDVVMGRWKPEANTHFGGKTEEQIKGKDGEGATRGRAAMVEHVDPRLTVEQAISQLRNAITQRIKSCNQGELIRCWIEFRTKTGASKEGVTLPEFRRGLRTYGIPLTYDRTEEMYRRFDENGDGQIQMKEFIDVVIGRDNGSYQTNHKAANLQNELRAAITKTEKKKRKSKELMPPTWKPIALATQEKAAAALMAAQAAQAAVPIPNNMIDMTNQWVDPSSERAAVRGIVADEPTSEAAESSRPSTGQISRSGRGEVKPAMPVVRPFTAAAKVDEGPATNTPPTISRRISEEPTRSRSSSRQMPASDPAASAPPGSGRPGTGLSRMSMSKKMRKPPPGLKASRSASALRGGQTNMQLVPLEVRQFLNSSNVADSSALLPTRTLQHHGKKLLGAKSKVVGSPIKSTRSLRN